MGYFIRLLLALVIAVVLLPGKALAQELDWLEQRTERFVILYTSGDHQTADEYAGFVDSIYDEVSAIFGHQTRTPVTLRLYPSLERYYELNPLARGLPGVVAHADFRRHEVVVIVPQTWSQTPDEIQNNVRHELAHIVIADLSDNRLNAAFHEGLAQYVEHPSRELEAKIRLLQLAFDENRLFTWSDLDDRDTVYSHPEISYPQSLSMVAFLVERYSFAKVREFLTVTARSSGYRSALQRAFDASPGELERQWREWLPSYLSGGYRRNALTAYDLSAVETLLEQGRYAEAERELKTALDWLRESGQSETLQEAEDLLDRSVEGQRAESLASEARAALASGDYDRAAGLVAQAQHMYAALGDTRQDAVLSAYAQRARRGMRAIELLNEARSQAGALLYPRAREAADAAAAEFLAIGDRARAEEALVLREFLDERQSLLGALLLLLGVGGIAVSVLRRLTGAETEAW